MHTTNTNRGWTCTEADGFTDKQQNERDKEDTLTLKCDLIHDAKALTICSQPLVCDVRAYALTCYLF